MTDRARSIVVGVDGSSHSAAAASWAAEDAHLRLRPLHLVMVDNNWARTADAEQIVQDLADRCRMQSPQVTVTEEVVPGHPAEVLISHSTRADMIVVGSRGRGGFAGTHLGSVSSSVAIHSSCPVVVARTEAGATGPVVVGLDTSPLSRHVLEFALEAAAVRKLGLVVMQVWRRPEHDDVFATPITLPSPADIDEAMRRRLAEQVAGHGEKYPDVRIRKVAQHGHPVSALAEASRKAELVVVGHRGRGGFKGMLLGSVASGVLHHAHCPVAVVRIPSASD
ncbi:universal stress protein [Saccharopolyspora phatthalungensis]|uniref:Nucleotide-binding universal stress UspA family protein n=1 Tax=Saccharopolyspora phatthalungensis TaxID=664693 RepID=A0A840QC42_9PSEU|nr:universal stress protein [Saccharopolyspora phatthalungensis]MBB5156015.1 nucleotide-binding universal stress UspA family protein [Saccharopolyspora phatthalungensis]